MTVNRKGPLDSGPFLFMVCFGPNRAKTHLLFSFGYLTGMKKSSGLPWRSTSAWRPPAPAAPDTSFQLLQEALQQLEGGVGIQKQVRTESRWAPAGHAKKGKEVAKKLNSKGKEKNVKVAAN